MSRHAPFPQMTVSPSHCNLAMNPTFPKSALSVTERPQKTASSPRIPSFCPSDALASSSTKDGAGVSSRLPWVQAAMPSSHAMLQARRAWLDEAGPGTRDRRGCRGAIKRTGPLFPVILSGRPSLPFCRHFSNLSSPGGATPSCCFPVQ